jgi:hypothetical protein
MRVAFWLVVTVILLCVAIWWWGAHLPYSGAAGTAWLDFQPEGTGAMLVLFAALLVLFCAGLVVRLSRLVWSVLLAASLIPTFAAFYPYWLEHRFAMDQWLHPWEGSDVVLPLKISDGTFILSFVLDATLLSVVSCGYLLRSRPRPNKALQPTAGRSDD